MCHDDKISKARDSLVVLSEAMNHIGDEFAIYCFSGDYPVVEMYRFKAFGESFGVDVKKRIGSIEPREQNRDGAAIRYMTDYLKVMQKKTKILFVISDGRPEDRRYNNPLEDTRKAILEAKAIGVRPFSITVDTHGDDYLKDLFGDSAYCVCTDPTQLPEKAGKFYQKVAF